MNIFIKTNGEIRIKGCDLNFYNKIPRMKCDKKRDINQLLKCEICQNNLIKSNFIEHSIYINLNNGGFMCNNCIKYRGDIFEFKKINILDIIEFYCCVCNNLIKYNFCLDIHGKYYCGKCQKIERKLSQCVKKISYIFNFDKVFNIIYKLDTSLILLDEDNIIYFYYPFNGLKKLIKTKMDKGFFKNFFLRNITHDFINKDLKKNVFLNKDEILEYLYEKLKIHEDFTIL